jgi:hypothetical protein
MSQEPLTIIEPAYLYEAYSGMLYKIICCHSNNNKQADIVFENVFKEIGRTINDYTPEAGPFKLWLAGIARRLATESLAASNTNVYRQSRTVDTFSDEKRPPELPGTYPAQ